MKALIDIIPRMWAPSWCVSEETVFLVHVGPVWPSHVVSEGYNIYTFIKDAKAEKSSMAGKNPRIRVIQVSNQMNFETSSRSKGFAVTRCTHTSFYTIPKVLLYGYSTFRMTDIWGFEVFRFQHQHRVRFKIAPRLRAGLAGGQGWDHVSHHVGIHPTALGDLAIRGVSWGSGGFTLWVPW